MVEAAGAAAVLGLGFGTINLVMLPARRSALYEQISASSTARSGVLFLPEPFRDAILYNPLVHIIMWFRSSIYAEYRADGMDKEYVLVFALVCFVLGLTLLTASMRQIWEARV